MGEGLLKNAWPVTQRQGLLRARFARFSRKRAPVLHPLGNTEIVSSMRLVDKPDAQQYHPLPILRASRDLHGVARFLAQNAPDRGER